MKLIRTGIIIFIFLCSGFAHGFIHESTPESIIQETITISTPTIIYENNSASIEFEEANMMLMRPHLPIVPAYKKIYVFPIGTTISSVQVSAESPIHLQQVNRRMQYAPEVYTPNGIHSISTVTNQNDQKFRMGIYPSSWYEYKINAGLIEGELSIILTIMYFPVRYVYQTIFSVSGFSTEITYTIPADPLPTKDDVDLLVIAPEIFTDALQPFIDHKQGLDITSKLVSVEAIYDETYFPLNGRDEAEQVKYFIKNAYEEWGIRYVLLVGGRKPNILQQWYVPVRYVDVFWAEESSYISDLYFADFYTGNMSFSSWDTDGNDRFSEWKNNGFLKDDVDLYPDVIIGRWPCRNNFEVKIMVKKTITYETSTLDKNVVLVGGDNFADQGIEGEIVCDKTLEYLPDFSVNKVYSTEMSVNPEAMRDALGEGAIFMHMHGHGSPVKWGTHPPENFDEWEEGLYITDIPSFSNNQYPIMIVGGCHTALFNISLFNKPYTYTLRPTPEDISWWMTRKIDGGGIASLGYTNFPVASPGEYGDLDGDGINEPDCVESGYGFIQLEFFEGYGDEKLNKLGECWQYAVQQYLDVYMYPYERWHLHTAQGFVLIGDPSLQIGGY